MSASLKKSSVRATTAAQTAVVTNNCTFCGRRQRTLAPNGGLYVFGASTLTRKFNFNFFANRVMAIWIMILVPARNIRASVHSGRCARAALLQLDSALVCDDAARRVCNAPLDPGPGTFFHIDARHDLSAFDAAEHQFEFYQTETAAIRHRVCWPLTRTSFR